MNSNFLVLNFHDISLKKSHKDNYTIDIDTFKDIIKLIKSSDSQIKITFDDGYKSHHDLVLQILEDNLMTAEFFIITSLIDKTEYMSKNELKEIKSLGHQISSHTHSHQNLTKRSNSDIELDMLQSKDILQSITAEEIKNLAFPFGKYNSNIISSLKNMGFETFYSTQFKLNLNSEIVGRLNIRNDFSLQYIHNLINLQFPQYHLRSSLSALKTYLKF